MAGIQNATPLKPEIIIIDFEIRVMNAYVKY